MEKISKKGIIIGIVVLVLAIGAAVFFSMRSSSKQGASPADTVASGNQEKIEELSKEAVGKMEFKELETQDKKAELTKPSQELPSPDKTIVTKVFDLKIENGAYSFPQVVVKKGDNVQFRFTALGSAQDLAMAYPVGAYVTAKANEVATFGFLAQEAGTYEFGCDKACPAGQKVSGKLIIQ
jgi:plastocyanin